MATIDVTADGDAVVLTIGDGTRVRCRLRLTEKRARELGGQLVRASMIAQEGGDGPAGVMDMLRNIVGKK